MWTASILQPLIYEINQYDNSMLLNMFRNVVTLLFLCSSFSALNSHVKISSQPTVRMGFCNPLRSSVHLKAFLYTAHFNLLNTPVSILVCSFFCSRSIIIHISCIQVPLFLYDRWYALLILTVSCLQENASETDMSPYLQLFSTKEFCKRNPIVCTTNGHEEENNCTTAFLNSNNFAPNPFSSAIAHSFLPLLYINLFINELYIVCTVVIFRDFVYLVTRPTKCTELEISRQ